MNAPFATITESRAFAERVYGKTVAPPVEVIAHRPARLCRQCFGNRVQEDIDERTGCVTIRRCVVCRGEGIL